VTLARGVNRRKAQAAIIFALGLFCLVAVLQAAPAPAQTGFLACVKLKKPDKGVLRVPLSGSCRASERGILINQTGPQGTPGTPGGPPGPQGIQGPIGVGTQGPAGVSGYATAVPVTSPVKAATDTSDTETATCPAGTKVLGGGYSIAAADAGGVVATASFPSGTGTWQVNAQVVAGFTLTGTWTVTAYATCATA
jgi:hypothetical protein